MNCFKSIHQFVKYAHNRSISELFMPIILQLLGENLKNKRKDGTLVHELGVIYYERFSHYKTKFKKMSQWWLVDKFDVVCSMPQSSVEKVSGKHVLYSFDFDPESVGHEKGQEKERKEIKGIVCHVHKFITFHILFTY